MEQATLWNSIIPITIPIVLATIVFACLSSVFVMFNIVLSYKRLMSCNVPTCVPILLPQGVGVLQPDTPYIIQSNAELSQIYF